MRNKEPQAGVRNRRDRKAADPGRGVGKENDDPGSATNGSSISSEPPLIPAHVSPERTGGFSLRSCGRLLYWGTLLAQFIITSVSLTFLYSNVFFWPITTVRGVLDFGALLHLTVFCVSSALTQYNFMMAIFLGPGYVPLKWQPEKDEQRSLLQYCSTCQGYKAPRAHHCQKCGRCVLKMEHHCPWINNCVGHRNHAYFLRFLFFAVCGCFHAIVVFLIIVIRIFNYIYTDFYYNNRHGSRSASGWGRLFAFQPPPIFFTLPGLLWIVVMIGFAVGVVIAVGALFVIQLRIILKNETSIETWIIDKANYYMKEEAESSGKETKGNSPRSFKNPYNIGWRSNLQQVILNRTHNPVGNGIWWDVRPDCDQFTLTTEQLRQKQLKNESSVMFSVQQAYGGQLFPLRSQGCAVCLSFPWTIDESRLKLQRGDVVRVTRFQKRWLYGVKVPGEIIVGHDKKFGDNLDSSGLKIEEKGWFPRKVAVKMSES